MESQELEVRDENSQGENSSLYDFTRKSVVGAVYRVGTSFAIDAVYLSLLAAGAYYLEEGVDALGSLYNGFSDFGRSFDVGKFGRVAAAVVGINFIDYRWRVTERLDGVAKNIDLKVRKGLEKILGKSGDKNGDF
jgi:hypothetical protein